MSAASTLTINLASERDLEALIKISISTFEETYAKVNTPENMAAYKAQNFSLPAMKMQLSQPGTQFYLAEYEGQVVGYLKLNTGTAQTESQPGNALEIERIYLLRSQQGRGFGKMLAQKAIDLALQNKAQYLWLGVWEKNPNAIGFYERMGFVEFDRHIFKLGSDAQTDLMMKLELQQAGLAGRNNDIKS